MIPLFGSVLQDMDCDVLMIHRNLIHWLPQDEDWYWYERCSVSSVIYGLCALLHIAAGTQNNRNLGDGSNTDDSCFLHYVSSLVTSDCTFGGSLNSHSFH